MATKVEAGGTQATRSRWRPHRSTWLVLVLVAGLFVLLNVPGSSTDRQVGYQHGWPFVYGVSIERQLDPKLLARSFSGYLERLGSSEPGRWFWNSHPRVDSARAAWIDLAIAVGAMALVGCLWEWRRRRGASAWRFGVRELLGLVLIAALACGWWVRWQSYDQRQRAALSALDELSNSYSRNKARYSGTVHEKYVGPRWLSHLVGGQRLPEMFWQDPNLALTVVTRRDAPRRLAALAQLQSIERLSLAGTTIDDDWLAAVAQLGNLRELYLLGVSVSANGLDLLNSLPRLERIVIDYEERPFGRPQLSPLMKMNEQLERQQALTRQDIARLRRAMPHIEIVTP